MKLRLLGPAEPASQERFGAAVRALCAAALEHRARTAGRLPADVPGQRQTRPHPAGVTTRA
ncbi:hypothetical protein SHKM778_78680 [Streptomyces sp. KM77-8]|uniref:Acyl-CoA carboxylase subunit epsilon n=1 Tax=Streptomyces haneummycinicus TaxID=3074435 RepID=A0AAT9HW16_9ACTN